MDKLTIGDNMEIYLQLTTDRPYIFNFSTFKVVLDGETKTVPITPEQADIVEADPNMVSMFNSGELILHRKKDDRVQSISKKGNIRTNDPDD